MLCSVATSQTPEFPVVGDWANRDDGSEFSGKAPNAVPWTEIDPLGFNWLKVNLHEVDETTEAILDHAGYKYIVERQMNHLNAPYRECRTYYPGSNRSISSIASFLGRYVRGSFALRLQAESDFDFVIHDDNYGDVTAIPGGDVTPFTRFDETLNAIVSEYGKHSEGVVASDPTTNDHLPSPLRDLRLQDITWVSIRVKLAQVPSSSVSVYTVRFRYEIDGFWFNAGSVTFEYPGTSPGAFLPTTDWQIVTMPISMTNSSYNNDKDIEVIWEGDVGAAIDWVQVSNKCSKEVLFDAAMETQIRSSIAWYNGLGDRRNNIGKLFTNDETSYPEFYNLGFVNGLIADELASAATGFSFYIDLTTDRRYRWGYHKLAGIKEMSVTGWAFHWDPDILHPVFDDGPQTWHAQAGIQAAAANYRPLATTVRDGLAGKEFWPVIQTHGQPASAAVQTRFPRHEEIKANTGIALSYGAKAIVAHIVLGDEDYTGLIGDQYAPWTWRDRTRDSLRISIVPRLRGVLGDHFLNLTWEDTWEGGYFDLDEQIILQHNRNAKCAAVSARPEAGVPDTTVYVQLANFHDASNEEFVFVVNKRTMENSKGDRIIELTFESDTSLFFMDVESHEIEVIPPNGVKTSRLPAGEFCLLRAASNLLTEDLTVDNVMHIRAGAGFHVYSTLTIGAGAHVYVENGAKLYLRDEGALVLDGGTIVFEGTGELLMESSDGLRGSGTIITPNIHVAGDLVIASGSDVTLEGCGTFGFNYLQTGVSHSILVQGALRLRGSGCAFSFDQLLDDILVAGSGVFDARGAITLNALPHINVTDNASFIVVGEDEVDRCVLKFRDRMEFNTQSLLRMQFVLVTGLNATDEWEGILVVGDNALCDLSYVDIEKVYCDPVYQGSGVHFYEAAHSQNRISNCNILRQNKADKKGDGIFLQPGAGTSYVDIRCSTTGDDWWTGVTTVSSEIDIIGLEASGNLRGLGAHLDGTVVEMQQSVLYGNAFEGVFADNSDISLGKYGDGLNLISQNGDIQIDLTQGSRLLQISPQHGCGNDIGHTSSAVPRVRTHGSSIAQAVNNYWLTGNPDPGMFPEVNQGSIDWNPYLATSAVAQATEWECNILQKRSAPMLTGAPTRATLADYARAGRMTEVYSLLDSAIMNTTTSAARATLLRELMKMELFHLREFPDSTQASRNRLLQYVRRQQTNISAPFAGDLVALQAVYFTFAGYPDSADMHYDMLARSYGNTAAYRNSLHARLCNSFIKLDSAAIDETIIAMNAAGLDSSSLRLARTERRAYHRCRKSGIMPKRRDHTADVALPGTLIQMTTHPNPANPTTAVSMMLPEAMHLKIVLLTVDGRELRTLYDGYRDKGLFVLPVDLSGLQSGVYSCALRAGEYTGFARILTLK
ncbi:MAG: hypothetical protein M5R41_13390 [Bacteroidia bacterium]|nr:hypothetical protein [Bacteroidia bacterium]